MKTVRFAQVVARSGRPEPHTLWSDPKDDRELQTALRQQRVMTVHQETTGQKKDYGEVGYTHDRQGNLLIFPKSLKPFAGARVVGVKYDLLDSPAPKARKRPTAKPKPAAAPNAAPVLRVYRPEEEEKPKPEVKAEPLSAEQLRAAIRRAMKQLKSGKAVAAYGTLKEAADGRPG